MEGRHVLVVEFGGHESKQYLQDLHDCEVAFRCNGSAQGNSYRAQKLCFLVPSLTHIFDLLK